MVINVDLKVKRLDKNATVPCYAHPGDAGLDLYAVEPTVIEPGSISLVRTGIAIQLPVGTEAQIRPRSGLALKFGITVLNSPGTIDEGYRGEIGVILVNHSSVPFNVAAGSKIAQLVVKPVITVSVLDVEELTDTSRGASGFGSTGH
jgi:dUTP pyrophosphatase